MPYGAMGKRPDSQGKVRDIYDCGDSLLMVASDRISAYDFILPDEIPYKGEILTRVSAFWFKKFENILPNHVISLGPGRLPGRVRRVQGLPPWSLHAREEGHYGAHRVHRAWLPHWLGQEDL